MDRPVEDTKGSRRDGAERELSALLDEMDGMLSRSRSLYGDFWGGSGKTPAPPDRAAQKPETAEEPAGTDKGPEREEAQPEETLEEAVAQLRALIGLEAVKADVESLINLVKVRALRQERGMKCPEMSLHLVFSGNPGTGKTTVARLIGRIYRALGVLSKGQLVEVDRSGLVAGYVGQTAIKTREVIDKALGGILFVDEAYTLAPANADKDFGQEAIDTLLKAMEDHRDDFVVIVAGYESLMPRFIESNPGLKSRFNKYIHFPDYTGQELWEIFQGRVQRSDYQLEEDAARRLEAYWAERYARRGAEFGNAREVRNVFEKTVAAQADRLAAVAQPTDQQLRAITLADVEAALCPKKGQGA